MSTNKQLVTKGTRAWDAATRRLQDTEVLATARDLAQKGVEAEPAPAGKDFR